MKKCTSITLLLIFIACILYCENLIAQSLLTLRYEPTIFVKPLSHTFVTINIDIAKHGYIYANPKGPGTGKPTTVHATVNTPFIKVHPIKYLPGTQYVSPLDSQPVYIYKNTTKVDIPLSIETNTEQSYKMDVTVDALFCDDSSCTPLQKTISITLHVRKGIVHTSSPVTQINESHEMTQKTHEKSDIFIPIELTHIPISLLYAFVFSILAGFLLNFMPCVLPVVSLKVFHFVQYSQFKPSQVRSLGMAFTAGMLTSFLILAILAAYAGYNWGQIFQHTHFVMYMAVVIFAFALSFFGVYTFTFSHIPQLQSTNVYIDSYLKGIVATLLATPCSGPFLGAVLAWSLSQPPIVIFITFINIGIGMSLPYLFLIFFPSLLRFIPKPGDWLITFEHIMGFLLIGTTVYLLTLLDATTLKSALWMILVTAIGLWQWGKYGNITKPLFQRILSLIILISCIAIGIALAHVTTTSTREIEGKPFTWDSVYGNRHSQISMVYFTADWCPNCKVVEALALKSNKVQEFIQKHNIHVYKADITKKNPEAEALMQRLGTRSIPFLAIFPKGSHFHKPVILRDVYTASDCINALQKALSLSNDHDVPVLTIQQ